MFQIVTILVDQIIPEQFGIMNKFSGNIFLKYPKNSKLNNSDKYA